MHGFRRHPRADDLHRRRPFTPQGTPLRNGGGARYRSVAEHALGSTRRQASNALYPEQYRRGLAHDRHHRRSRVGIRCIRLIGLTAPRQAFLSIAATQSEANARAVRHHDQAFPAGHAAGPVYGAGLLASGGFPGRTRPWQGRRGDVSVDVVGEHAGGSAVEGLRTALADLRQRVSYGACG